MVANDIHVLFEKDYDQTVEWLLLWKCKIRITGQIVRVPQRYIEQQCEIVA